MAAAAARGATRTAAALRDADVYIADVQRVVTSYTALVEVRAARRSRLDAQHV